MKRKNKLDNFQKAIRRLKEVIDFQHFLKQETSHNKKETEIASKNLPKANLWQVIC